VKNNVLANSVIQISNFSHTNLTQTFICVNERGLPCSITHYGGRSAYPLPRGGCGGGNFPHLLPRFLDPSHLEILKLGTLLLLLLPQILFSPATKVAAHYPGNNPWSEGQYIIAQKF
jgi:hypothetical protein